MRTGKIVGRLPRPVGDMPAVFARGASYVFGGATGQECTDVISRVAADGAVDEVGRLPVAMRAHQAVLLGDSVYVLGGFDGETRRDVFRLDLGDWRATPVSPMPRPAGWFTATAVERRIYVVGGFAGGPHAYWTQMAVYDADTDRWDSVERGFDHPVFPKGQVGSNSAVSHEGRIVSFGGADTFDHGRMRANALSCAAEYDPSVGTWRPLPARIVAREGLVAVRDGRFAYLVGGMSAAPEAPVALVERVDLRTGRSAAFATLSTARVAPGATIDGNVLLVIGGVVDPPFEMTAEIEAVGLS